MRRSSEQRRRLRRHARVATVLASYNGEWLIMPYKSADNTAPARDTSIRQVDHAQQRPRASERIRAGIFAS